MSRTALAIGLLATSFLAGCANLPFIAADAPAGWTTSRCDPSGATSITGNAPLAAGLLEPPQVIAQVIAAGLGDPLAARLAADDRYPRWSTSGGGTLSLSILPSGQFYMALYEGPARVDRFVVEGLLDDLAVDVDQVWMGNGQLVPGDRSDGPAFQVALDLPVLWANGGATWSADPGAGTVLALLPFYHLPWGSAAVPREAAVATALSYARCEGGLGSQPGGDVVASGVMHGSLGYVVAAEAGGTSPCGPRLYVYVDAVTGAVLGSHGEPCV